MVFRFTHQYYMHCKNRCLYRMYFIGRCYKKWLLSLTTYYRLHYRLVSRFACHYYTHCTHTYIKGTGRYYNSDTGEECFRMQVCSTSHTTSIYNTTGFFHVHTFLSNITSAKPPSYLLLNIELIIFTNMIFWHNRNDVTDSLFRINKRGEQASVGVGVGD